MEKKDFLKWLFCFWFSGLNSYNWKFAKFIGANEAQELILWVIFVIIIVIGTKYLLDSVYDQHENK